ncbi:beta-lactamase family protein [Saccharothrix sp. S26]|uniref:serine hydrolase domain-containing protein n=1 Tax=Saccharothrix sp. S26 TaxID=2907215 RepID=UPI001F15CA92|nr:serine hydrolase domain-containing protein [Saccharothrix sp. S26]MCE7000406.1 beta-lactamase family protein [Saccharothrix sp. S26]
MTTHHAPRPDRTETSPTRASRRTVLAALGVGPLAASALLGAGPARAATESGRIPDGLRPGGEFDRYLAQLAEQDAFSGTVLLSQGDRTVLARSHGMADKARGIPNGPDTVFNLGSITKLFTATAIHQLAEQGRLAYNTPLKAYLSGLRPEVAESVTVHQLLTHTSGFGRPAVNPPRPPGQDQWTTLDEMFAGTMDYLRGLSLTFTPGTRNVYSNDGYYVLGAIVAELSGRSYYDYVREHVFAPAGMATAGFPTAAQWREDRRTARPYDKLDGGTWTEVIHLFDAGLLGSPAGGAFASAADLVRYANAFQRNRLHSAAYVHLAASPKWPMAADNTFFEGYGPSTHYLNGQRINGHNGGARGVSTNVDWFPDSGWTTVVLANYGMAAVGVNRKVRQLIAGVR